MEVDPKSDGRELTWIGGAVPDTGRYDMFLVRFRSKTDASNFKMAFVCGRELIQLGQRSAAASATNTGEHHHHHHNHKL